jgi:ketol-acid reductoisomerase
MTALDPAGSPVLQGARIVVLGYDTEARNHALALRRAGNHVMIGLLGDSEAWARASADGFQVAQGETVVEGADVVVVREHEETPLWRSCEGWIAGGALVVFASARALHTGRCARSGMDVVLVTSIEDAVIGCRIGVHRDVSRRALVRAVAYARAAYSADAVLRSTYICDEADREVASGRERMGSLLALTAQTSPRLQAKEPWNADAEPEPADIDDAGWFYAMMNRRGTW